MIERGDIMIDFAGNFLPGFIGGPKTVAQGAERISALCRSGIDIMLLTPRYYPAKLSVAEFIARRDKAIADIKPKKPFPAIIPACEVYIDERLKYISEIGQLAIAGTHTIIADMPDGIWESALLDTIYGIQSTGYDVVISHIDRYPAKYAEDLFSLGYKGIIDISAFCGISNVLRCRKYFEWIDKGNIVAIGTNYTADEKKPIEKLLKIQKIIGQERMKRIESESKRVLGIK